MHLYTAEVMRSLADGESGLSELFFVDRTRFHTNMFLQKVFASLLRYLEPQVLDSVFQFVYVVLFVLGFYYCLRAIKRENSFFVLFCVPFIYSYLFHMGFYNFVFAQIPLLFGIGLTLQLFQKQKWPFFAILGIALLHMVCFLCHMTSYVVLVGFTFASSFFYGISLWRKRLLTVRTAICMVSPSIIAVLGVSLIAIFLMEYHGGEAYYEPKLLLLKNLLHLESIVGFGHSDERLVTQCLFWLCVFYMVVLVVRRTVAWKWQWPDSLLVCSFGLFFMYFMLPLYGIGSGMITTRAMLFPFYFLIFWFATFEYPKVVRIASIACFGVISSFFISIQMREYRRFEPLIDDFMTTKEQIREGDVFYPIILDGNGYDDGYISAKLGYFLNLANYFSAEVPNTVNICNAVANEKFSPIGWNPSVSYDGTYMMMPGQIPDMQFEHVSKNHLDKLNVILIWGAGEKLPWVDHVVKVERQIPKSFSKSWTSPAGRMILYRKGTG